MELWCFMLYPRRRYTPRLHKIRAPLLLTSYSIITSVKIEKMTGFPYPWNHGHFHSQFYKWWGVFGASTITQCGKARIRNQLLTSKLLLWWLNAPSSLCFKKLDLRCQQQQQQHASELSINVYPPWFCSYILDWFWSDPWRKRASFRTSNPISFRIALVSASSSCHIDNS